jgi:hypothetical protein
MKSEMVTIVGINPITLEVYLSDGDKVNCGDFFNTPKVGYGVEVLHDVGYRAIPVGDSGDCVSGVCPIK